MEGGFLLQSIIYLGAAVLCVPVARKLGLGSVLGYLLAGILIGPFVLGFVGEEGKDIMHFAEFGVVVMLFLIGLELDPTKLWKLRTQIFGVGFAQVAGSTLLFFLAGILLQYPWQSALAVSLALAMSSTAIVLQSLKESGRLDSGAGRYGFAVLLFQDVSVIPILAMLPLLIFLPVSGTAAPGHGFLAPYPGWLQTIMVLGAVSLVVAIGRFAIVPFLRFVAKARLRELFTASALLIVVAIAYTMELVGLSPALGTFLAGVILANSEFKHELESDLDPFKGLLLGLFFVAVGASINFHLLAENPVTILTLTLAITMVKASVMFGIGRVVRLSTEQNAFFALSLSQIGEFAFVLLSLIGQLNILSSADTGVMMAVTALSMTTTPLFLIVHDRFMVPRFGTPQKADTPADTIEDRNQVIIAGFSHFGSTIGRFLRANGVQATILDNDSDRVELLRKMGFKVYYGDATRLDLLESAGAEHARILVIAIDEPDTVFGLVQNVQRHFPNLVLMTRSRNREYAYELLDLGVENIYREHLDTSIRLGVDVLKKLGHRSYSATRSGQKFREYDEAAMRTLASHRKDTKQYIMNVRQQIELQEELLRNDRIADPTSGDHAWDSEFMRETMTKG